MTDETESVKKQILATGNAEILLEENDFLIVKWIKPEVTYTMEAFMYGKTGMANNYPWSHKLSETQAFYFLENVNEAIEYFKAKHHYFHVEVKENMILFNLKGIFAKRKNIKEFNKIQNMIIEFGYTTYDLS